MYTSSGYVSMYLVHLELKASSETNECEREPGHLTDRFLKSLRSWLLLRQQKFSTA